MGQHREAIIKRINGFEKSLVVTGSSGFVGDAVLRHFSQDHYIHALDYRRPTKELPPHVRFIKTDFTSEESVEAAMSKIEETGLAISSVIHLASYHDLSGRPSDLFERITVQGTQRLLAHLKRTHIPVEQFLFLSSMLVHLPGEVGRPINEQWPIQGRWDFSRSKVEAENYLANNHAGIPLVIFRPAWIYTDECLSPLLAGQIQRIYEKKWIGHYYPGNVHHGRAYVHLDDLIEAMDLAVRKRKILPASSTFLIGEPETLSYGEIQDLIADTLGEDEENWRTHHVPRGLAKVGAWLFMRKAGNWRGPFTVDLADDHYELDISRAKELLGWWPEKRLRKALPKMVRALKRHPLEWYKINKLRPPQSLLQEQKRSA